MILQKWQYHEIRFELYVIPLHCRTGPDGDGGGDGEDATQLEFCDNYIRTSKYTVYTIVPK